LHFDDVKRALRVFALDVDDRQLQLLDLGPLRRIEERDLGDAVGFIELEDVVQEPDEGVFMLNPKNVISQQGYSTFETYADMQGFVKFDVKENSATDPFNKYEDINSDLYRTTIIQIEPETDK